jgi:enoyl-CoA hydratase/carnithine racemase
VSLTFEENIATLSLSRPDKRNALDMAMFVELRDAIKTLKRNRTLRGVLLIGEGEDFCSGLDVKSVLTSSSNALRLLWKWLPGQPNLAQFVSVGFRQLSVPVVCAIHGRCWGGGLQIALGADFRITSPSASLSIMEGKWGLIPDMGGTLALRELLPADHAMYLAMSAKEITADEALGMHLVTEVHEDPIARGRALLEELCQRSPDSLAAVKKLYQRAWHHNDRGILARETWYQLRILSGKNQQIATKRATKDPDKPFVPRKHW